MKKQSFRMVSVSEEIQKKLKTYVVINDLKSYSEGIEELLKKSEKQ